MTKAGCGTPARRESQQLRPNGNHTDREMKDMQTVHPSPEAVRLAMARIRRAVDTHGGDREAPMDWGATAAARSPAMAAGMRLAA